MHCASSPLNCLSLWPSDFSLLLLQSPVAAATSTSAAATAAATSTSISSDWSTDVTRVMGGCEMKRITHASLHLFLTCVTQWDGWKEEEAGSRERWKGGKGARGKRRSTSLRIDLLWCECEKRELLGAGSRWHSIVHERQWIESENNNEAEAVKCTPMQCAARCGWLLARRRTHHAPATRNTRAKGRGGSIYHSIPAQHYSPFSEKHLGTRVALSLSPLATRPLHLWKRTSRVPTAARWATVCISR